MKLTDIKPNPRNPRTISTDKLEKLKNKLDNVLFVSYSTNIFGIKLK